MRFRPKARILTRAWWAAGVGLGTCGLMKRASMGPLPPLMSGMGCEPGSLARASWGCDPGGGRGLTDCFHVLRHLGYCSVSCQGVDWLLLASGLRMNAGVLVPSPMSSTRMRNDVEPGVVTGGPKCEKRLDM